MKWKYPSVRRDWKVSKTPSAVHFTYKISCLEDSSDSETEVKVKVPAVVKKAPAPAKVPAGGESSRVSSDDELPDIETPVTKKKQNIRNLRYCSPEGVMAGF